MSIRKRFDENQTAINLGMAGIQLAVAVFIGIAGVYVAGKANQISTRQAELGELQTKAAERSLELAELQLKPQFRFKLNKQMVSGVPYDSVEIYNDGGALLGMGVTVLDFMQIETEKGRSWFPCHLHHARSNGEPRGLVGTIDAFESVRMLPGLAYVEGVDLNSLRALQELSDELSARNAQVVDVWSYIQISSRTALGEEIDFFVMRTAPYLSYIPPFGNAGLLRLPNEEKSKFLDCQGHGLLETKMLGELSAQEILDNLVCEGWEPPGFERW